MKNLNLFLKIGLWVNMGLFLLYVLIANVIDGKLLLIVSPLILVLVLYKCFKKNILLIMSCIIMHVIYLITEESLNYYLAITIICVVAQIFTVIVFQRYVVRAKPTDSLIPKEIEAIGAVLIAVAVWIFILARALNGLEVSFAPLLVATSINLAILQTNRWCSNKRDNEHLDNKTSKTK